MNSWMCLQTDIVIVSSDLQVARIIHGVQTVNARYCALTDG